MIGWRRWGITNDRQKRWAVDWRQGALCVPIEAASVGIAGRHLPVTGHGLAARACTDGVEVDPGQWRLHPGLELERRRTDVGHAGSLQYLEHHQSQFCRRDRLQPD